ncbi:MAG: hypothetical protein JKY52_18700 [Flavobacteriales bacterium]|nr:hypothetical protein [Flavobacteriales bacterium]
MAKDALVSGHFYPGDLLSTVTSVKKEFWLDNARYQDEINAIIERNKVRISEEGLTIEQIA